MNARAELEAKFAKSRGNLLLVVAFSAVNVILVLVNASISFLFSATFPLLSVEFGRLFAAQFGRPNLATVGILLAFIAIGLYLICYLQSKTTRAFILVALILFSIDTLFLIWLLTFGVDFSIILDIAFHGWVMYYLIIGVRAWAGLKKLPPEEVPAPLSLDSSGMPIRPQSVALRPPSTKGKIIIEQFFGDLRIVVLRARGVTELVVNGMVYAERRGIFESPYSLEAMVGTAFILITLDNSNLMSLYVNGNLLAKKRRLA